MQWPRSRAELEEVQRDLAAADPEPYRGSGDLLFGGCFVCFTRARPGPGFADEPGWAAAVALRMTGTAESAAVGGPAGAAYEPEYLALREGPLLARAVLRLPEKPDVLIVNASGRDHSRRAGLALHLGAVLDTPTIGVTRRPLRAVGEEPVNRPGATAPLLLEGEVVGYMVRTKRGARALAVHAAWRTGPDVAVEIALAAAGRARTPEPIRRARRMARLARAWCAPEKEDSG